DPKIVCEQGQGCDYWITQQTKIILNCTDQQPHPSGHVTLYWRYKVDDGQFTNWLEETDGYVEFTFSEDSVHTLEYYCKDVLGNTESTHTEIDKVDTVPPTTTKTYGQPLVEAQGGYPKWINSSTPITLTATDGGAFCAVGVDKIYWRNTVVGDSYCQSDYNCQNIVGQGYFVEYTGPFTKPEESCHLIEYYAIDKLGNVEPVKKQCVFVENTPPVSQKTLGTPKHACLPNETLEGITDCWYVTQNTEVNLSCSDVTPHPVNQVKIYYKIDWKNESSDQWTEGQWQQAGDKVSFKYNKDSYHKLTWYCVDALGNKEQEHVELDIVDTQAPVSQKSFIGTAIPCSQLHCAVSGECDYYITQNTTIKLTCSDQQPHPVDHEKIYYRYFVDGQLKQNWTLYEEPIQYNEDSEHRLEWYCVDELGNQEQTHVEIDRVDTTPPETNKTIGDPKWWDESKGMYWVTSKTPITLAVKDKQETCASGPSELSYEVRWDQNCDGQIDGKKQAGTVYVDPNCNLNKTIYLGEECLHMIKWHAVDALGNVEQEHVQYHKVDNTPPHILILKPVDGWYSDGEDIPIVALAEDLSNPEGPCGPLSHECAVGIEDGKECYAYLIDVLPEFKIVQLESHLKYNASAHECQGYATIPSPSNITDGVVILAVSVSDNLGNEGNSLEEIMKIIKMRCNNNQIPECIADAIQDIVTIWNLPKIGIDNHAPVVKIISPEAGTLFGGEQVYVEANVTDSSDGEVTSTITSGTPCYITVGGISLGTVPYNNENRKCQGTIMIPQDEDFPQGKQELKVEIADNAGNMGSDSIVVSVDTTKPVLDILQPSQNQFVKDIVTIKLSATDSNLNTSKIMVSTDNGQTWNSVYSCGSDYCYDWNTTVETDGMAYGIIAKATDNAGNTGYSEMVIVIVDNGAPEGVYMTTPIKDEIVQGTITLKALATDYVSGVQSVKIYVNNGPWSCDATLAGGTWQCSLNTATLSDGQHSAYAVATDNLGHQTTSASVPFIIDNNPPEVPELYVNDPDHDGYDTDGTLTWYWNESTDEGSGLDHYVILITYSENPQQIYTKVYGTTFTYSDLPDGTWHAKVKAVDKAGHESDWSDTVNITVDKTKPSPVSINASNVENSPYDTNGNYNIIWSGGSDTNFDRYELYENDVKIYSGSSNSMSLSKPDGTYEYYVTAYDKAGWTTTSSKLKVTVDTEAPSIQITDTVPGIGFFIAVYSVNDAEPSSGIDRIVPTTDGYALCSGTISIGFCTVFLGSELNLTVYDKAGNSGIASTTGQEKDVTPPKITYSSPSGVIDYNEITLEVRTDEPATCYYGTEDNISTMIEMNSDKSKTVHTASLGVLTDGLKVYHVICEDLSGNWMDHSKTIVFYIDTTGNYLLTIPDYGHYWSTGWNTFFLPQLILNDLCNSTGPYPVENILSSLYNENGSANFDIIWYFNGTDWLAFMPEYPEYSDLIYFNDWSSLPYYIHITSEDRLEITLDNCGGYDLWPHHPPI
ncbi:MAG: Ig-like domain-containing protein, partial [Candidatus Aenigmatarchaeota archaeon]